VNKTKQLEEVDANFEDENVINSGRDGINGISNIEIQKTLGLQGQVVAKSKDRSGSPSPTLQPNNKRSASPEYPGGDKTPERNPDKEGK